VRVLVLTNLYPNPYQPNRAPWNRHQIRGLAEYHDVTVIAPILWTDEFRCRARQGRILPHNRSSQCDGLPVVHPRYVYPPKLLRALYGRCYRRSVQTAFHDAVRHFKPDVVFSSWAYPDGWTAVELSRQADLPVLVKVHGSDIHQLKLYPGRNAGTIAALKRADAIVAVSQELARQVAELGIDEAKIRVVYNGIDSGMFHPGCRLEARSRLGINGDRKVVLFVGNLVPVKGLDVLLEACGQLAQNGIRFRCDIVGDGPLRAKLGRLAQRLGIADCISWHGARPQHELPDWYRAADVVVLSSYSEGIPNVLLEAAACGARLVASRVGGIAELEQLGGCRFVTPGAPDELAREIQVCLASPDPVAADHRSLRTHETSGQELAALLDEVRQYRTSRASGRFAFAN
jgi:teichuronic acid biosynthesis glycosyltransferase TuaC